METEPGDPSPLVDPLDPDPQRLVWQPVAPALIWVVLAGTAATGAVAALAATVAWVMLGGPLPPAALALVVVLVGVRAALVRRAVRSWGYAERDDDLLIRHGLLIKRLSIVPYARMQFVDVTAGPLERLLGLATVTLHTAAAASDATVPGLAGPEAARLRDRLAALGAPAAEGL